MPDPPLCVYCRTRPAESSWAPFCSERCKMADLGRWLFGDYRVAGPPVDAEPHDDDDPPEAGGGSHGHHD
ncbi:MAG: DNA gyrase inhibitor YacG [Vicinamibacterales bacterium]